MYAYKSALHMQRVMTNSYDKLSRKKFLKRRPQKQTALSETEPPLSETEPPPPETEPLQPESEPPSPETEPSPFESEMAALSRKVCYIGVSM